MLAIVAKYFRESGAPLSMIPFMVGQLSKPPRDRQLRSTTKRQDSSREGVIPGDRNIEAAGTLALDNDFAVQCVRAHDSETCPKIILDFPPSPRA
jgi:hypothetical protein